MKKICRNFVFIVALAASTYPCYSQWGQQPIPTDLAILLGVDFLNSNQGIASGYKSGFLGRAIYSTNSGLNWMMAQVPDSARSLITVSYITPDTAYIVGAYNLPPSSQLHRVPANRKRPMQTNALKAIGMERYLDRIGIDRVDMYRGMFLASADGGMTWQTKGTLPESVFYMMGASFVNGSLGYATIDATPSVGVAGIVKTTNGGNSWTRLASPDSIPSLRNIRAIDSLTVIAVGYQLRNQIISGIILRSTDGGGVWQTQEFPAVDNFTDVFFSSSSTGFSVGVYSPPAIKGAIFKTTDAGVTWAPLSYSPDAVLIEGVRFASGSTTGIVYGEKFTPWGSFIARTTDEGSTWNEGMIDSVPANSILIGGKLVSPVEGFVCGGNIISSAFMLHTTNGGVTWVGRQGANHMEKYSLSQNYPNPFNPATKISYGLPHRETVHLSIFNTLGQQVAVLVRGEQEAGHHEVQFDASALTSGVYFYRLTSGSFVETKKLILLK